jgi:hypothetical protein
MWLWFCSTCKRLPCLVVTVCQEEDSRTIQRADGNAPDCRTPRVGRHGRKHLDFRGKMAQLLVLFVPWSPLLSSSPKKDRTEPGHGRKRRPETMTSDLWETTFALGAEHSHLPGHLCPNCRHCCVTASDGQITYRCSVHRPCPICVERKITDLQHRSNSFRGHIYERSFSISVQGQDVLSAYSW